MNGGILGPGVPYFQSQWESRFFGKKGLQRKIQTWVANASPDPQHFSLAIEKWVKSQGRPQIWMVHWFQFPEMVPRSHPSIGPEHLTGLEIGRFQIQ